MTTDLRSATYTGVVMHHRVDGPSHRFIYPVVMSLLDLSELPRLDERVALFGWNRFRPLSLYDRDYFEPTDTPIAEKLRRFTDGHGLAWPGGRVLLLTNCRVFGYAFNPASFFYLLDPGGRLAAVVADVSNTFGERHAYLLHAGNRVARDGPSGKPAGDRDASAGATAGDADLQAWSEKKVFHVSPFFSIDGTYRFELAVPDETCRVRIDLSVGGAPRLKAGLSLRRRPFDDRTLARALARYPFNTAAVVAAIHWEALKLWWKGAPFHSKPPYDPEAARRGVA